MVNDTDKEVNGARDRVLFKLTRDIIDDKTIKLYLEWCHRFGLEASVFMSAVLHREIHSEDGWATFKPTEVQEATSLTMSRQQAVEDALKGIGVLVVVQKSGRRKYQLNYVVLEALLTESGSLDGPLNGPLVPSEVLLSHTLSTPNSSNPLIVPPSTLPETKKKRTSRELRPIPEAFWPSDRCQEIVRGYPGINDSDIPFEVPKFVNYHTAKGNVWKDHDACFRTWMSNLSARRMGQPGGIVQTRTLDENLTVVSREKMLDEERRKSRR